MYRPASTAAEIAEDTIMNAIRVQYHNAAINGSTPEIRAEIARLSALLNAHPCSK